MRKLHPGLLCAPLLALASCQPAGEQGFIVEIFGRVVDENGQGAESVEVTLATDESALVGAATTDRDGWYRLPVFMETPGEHGIRVVASGEGYASSKSWIDVLIEEGDSHLLKANPPQTWSGSSYQLPPVTLVFSGASGSVEGVLVDASTGEPVSGIEIDLLSGWNAPSTEAAVARLRSGQNSSDAGRFSGTNISPGVYTAWVEASSGYSVARFPLVVRGSGSDFVRAALSRDDLAFDQMRLALCWGDAPSNLNLHLTGPKASIEGGGSQFDRYHVFEDAPQHPSSPPPGEDPVALMERSDVDAGGPESIMVLELRSEGRYRASVFDASNSGNSASTGLADSSAVLQVWIGSETPEFFQITPGVEGNTWLALEYDTGSETFYPHQEMSLVEEEADESSF